MKTCTRCEEAKPLDGFGNDKSRRSGKHPWCKTCLRERRQEWYRKNRESNLAYQAQWREKNPDKKRDSNQKWTAENKDRKRETDRAYRQANRDSIDARVAQWRRDNPERFAANSYAQNRRRRAHLANVEHHPYTRAGIYERDGGTCALCREHLAPNSNYEIDQLILVKVTI